MSVLAVELPVERSRLCERVLRDLPEWFGIEEATTAYIRDVAGLPTFGFDGDAILSLKLHTPRAAEIYVMGVRRARHGQGIGTALLRAAESYLSARGVEYLQVKTLGPSDPDAGYARTRAFYDARGFAPLEELHDLWERNPCSAPGQAPVMPLTVGTAGHIDHGKTWLVRALTGKDTDRLPEEQRRGISIDLGYALLRLADGRRLSVVDVPGHERFVRTMVAGATGIDLFLLVIDAGEGARPQTHEHLAILRLLGIERGVVALTKVDAVDAGGSRSRGGRGA